MDVLKQPLALPCGASLPNRLAKAAMTEGLADGALRATPSLERLYRTWSEGGCGLLLTGNVQVDRFDLERPANVAIDQSEPRTFDAEARARLAAWARAGTVNGNHLWVQLSHAGRQSPRYVTGRPLAPSPVQLDLLGSFARPRALTEDEILGLIRRFAHAAQVVREAGFTGVQVHGAHGYLISSFLSPVTNRRTDDWGGTLANRARFLRETVRAVRHAVGADFPVALKLNSDDFRKGGFTHDECLQVVAWLNDESLDLLEVSGGTYEQPRLIGFEGRDPARGAHAADGHRGIPHARGHDRRARRGRQRRLRRRRPGPAAVLESSVCTAAAGRRGERHRRHGCAPATARTRLVVAAGQDHRLARAECLWRAVLVLLPAVPARGGAAGGPRAQRVLDAA